jgi:hypothetical protein
VEKIAERKGLSYTPLLRMWIKEHLDKEKTLGKMPESNGGRIKFLKLRYALPVLRSPAKRDEGWMVHACLPS